MKDIIACLTFEGNCLEAMSFYRDCLGGDLYVVTYGEMPAAVPAKLADEDKNKVLHSSLSKGLVSLIGSDSMPGTPAQYGTNISVCVATESVEETDRLYTAFAKKAKILYKLGDAPWGARYGMLADQFGIQWMFNYSYPKA